MATAPCGIRSLERACALVSNSCLFRSGAQLETLPSCFSSFSFSSFSTSPSPSSTTSHADSNASSASRTIAPRPYFSVCLLERLPVIMPELEEWETEYQRWRERFERRRALPKDLVEETKIAGVAGLSEEPQWEPAPRQTAADRSGDRSTLQRRLDKRIFMLLRSGSGDWEFPSVELQEGETTRKGAERALAQVTDLEGFQPYFVGNAPAGHLTTTVARSVVEDDSGGPQMTVFFHRCQLIKGIPKLNEQARSQWNELVWVSKDELEEYIKDEGMLNLMQKML